ncbi:MAG: hypothetical protein H8D23_17690 [Candidatus Brocadiales bacterium]|nr:hypothetical protein [Candidatus Brocadiales bacterium]
MGLASLQLEKLNELLAKVSESDVAADSTLAAITSLLATDAMKSAAEDPEYLTITVSGVSAGDNFSTYTADTVQDVILQNLDATNAGYVTFSSTSAPTATSSMTYLPAGATISLTDVDYIYFAAISANANTINIRVTGIG